MFCEMKAKLFAILQKNWEEFVFIRFLRTVDFGTHSMEISGFFCRSDFSEINFGAYRSSKIAFFSILVTLIFVNLVTFSLKKCKNQDSLPLYVLKGHILYF